MKKLCLAFVVVLTFSLTSCLGPNRAFNGLHDWNEEVSENRWFNEGVFLVFNIIPVYGVCYLADIIVLNSIEWWTGDTAMEIVEG